MKPEGSAWSAIDAWSTALVGGEASPQLGAQERIRVDCVRLFLSHWRGSLIALVIVTLAIAVTGRDYVPPRTIIIWSAFAGTNTVFQAMVCRAMERAGSLAQAVRRWMPWMLASIAINSTIWGLVPLLVSPGSSSVLIVACLFNAMLLFCIANSPGTPGMTLSGAVPIAFLGTHALMRDGTLIYAGIGYAVLVAVIASYGLRLQSALRAGMLQRHAAEDLAVDLRAHQERLMALERERTLLLERQRLMRDMHDGLGSALVGALAAVERGNVQPHSLTAMLQDCVDDLRAVIYSLEPIDHDLVALLATLRFRIERRLDAVGVRIVWQVESLPPLTWIGPSEVLHVMRIVQEVLTNVIKHAAARHMRLATRAGEDSIEVRIEDDGRGFDLDTIVRGRGLQSLCQRARALGGEIVMESRPGQGTRVSLLLPIRDSRPDDVAEKMT